MTRREERGLVEAQTILPPPPGAGGPVIMNFKAPAANAAGGLQVQIPTQSINNGTGSSSAPLDGLATLGVAQIGIKSLDSIEVQTSAGLLQLNPGITTCIVKCDNEQLTVRLCEQSLTITIRALNGVAEKSTGSDNNDHYILRDSGPISSLQVSSGDGQFTEVAGTQEVTINFR